MKKQKKNRRTNNNKRRKLRKKCNIKFSYKRKCLYTFILFFFNKSTIFFLVID